MSTHLLPNQPSFASHSLARTRVAWHSPLERAYPRNMKSFGKNKGMKRVWKSLEEYLVQNLLGQPPKPKMLAEEQLQLFQVTVFFGISRHAPNLPCRLSLSTLRSRGTGSKNTGAGEGLKKTAGKPHRTVDHTAMKLNVLLVSFCLSILSAPGPKVGNATKKNI